MIPFFIMLIGLLVLGVGLYFLLMRRISPLAIRHRSLQGKPVEEPKKEYIKEYSNWGKVILIIGIVVFAVGYFIGYSDRGDGFWFYDLVYGSKGNIISEVNSSDKDKLIPDEEKTNSDTGKQIKIYRLTVKGNEYELSGQIYDNTSDLESVLSKIDMEESRFILIDDYASLSAYNDVKKRLSGYIEKEEQP